MIKQLRFYSLTAVLLLQLAGCSNKYTEPLLDNSVTFRVNNLLDSQTKLKVKVFVDGAYVEPAYELANSEAIEPNYRFKVSPGPHEIKVNVIGSINSDYYFWPKDEKTKINTQEGKSYLIQLLNNSNETEFMKYRLSISSSGQELFVKNISFNQNGDGYSNSDLTRDIINGVILPTVY